MEITPTVADSLGIGRLDDVLNAQGLEKLTSRKFERIATRGLRNDLRVSEMVVRRLIAQTILPAKQIVKFAPWMIEPTHLEFPRCARRFVEFTRADVRDGELTKNKSRYSRIPTKFSPHHCEQAASR